MADYSKPKAATEPVATKSVSFVTLKRIMGSGQCVVRPSDVLYVLYTNSVATITLRDGSKIHDIEPSAISKLTEADNATLSNLEGRDGDSK